MNSAMEIMNNGMNLLVRELGVVEAEQFISIINRERFDYTKWQEHLFNKSLKAAPALNACIFDPAILICSPVPGFFLSLQLLSLPQMF